MIVITLAFIAVCVIAAYALARWHDTEIESSNWEKRYYAAERRCAELVELLDDADADIAFLKANTTDLFMELQASYMQFIGAHKEVERLTAELEKAHSDIKRYFDRPKCPKCHRFLKNGVCSNAKCKEVAEPKALATPADLTDAPFEGLDGVKKGDYVLFSDGRLRKVVHIDRTRLLPQAIKVMPFVDDEVCYFNIGDGKHWENETPIRAIRIATPLDLKLYQFAESSKMIEKPAEKPLLAEAKVGDLCQRRDGKWVQIDRLCSLGGLPWICYEIGGLRYINNGQQLNSKPSDADIIHTEPLAPEGTAKWALQRMKLGDKVFNPKVNTLGGYSHIANNKVVWVTPRLDDWSYFCQEWLTMYADNALYKSGWQLWEEK